MARKPASKFRGEPVPAHRMIAVLVMGVAAALFAAGLAISAAYQRTQKERTRHDALPAVSSREIEIEIQ